MSNAQVSSILSSIPAGHYDHQDPVVGQDGLLSPNWTLLGLITKIEEMGSFLFCFI
jgi:hypothetical protein